MSTRDEIVLLDTSYQMIVSLDGQEFAIALSEDTGIQAGAQVYVQGSPPPHHYIYVLLEEAAGGFHVLTWAKPGAHHRLPTETWICIEADGELHVVASKNAVAQADWPSLLPRGDRKRKKGSTRESKCDDVNETDRPEDS